jgi:tRNA (guanine37-N1)-methyltransferase
MRIDVFTLFPKLVDDFCSESLLGRARKEHLVDLRTHDLREHTTDVHHSVDDSPFGGGAGMLIAAEPVFNARWQAIRSKVCKQAGNARRV